MWRLQLISLDLWGYYKAVTDAPLCTGIRTVVKSRYKRALIQGRRG